MTWDRVEDQSTKNLNWLIPTGLVPLARVQTYWPSR